MTLNIHLLNEYSPQITGHLRDQLEPNTRLTSGEYAANSGDINILVAGRPDRDIFVANRDLHTLVIPWTGIPPETIELITEFSHVAVHNLHHNASPVAEMTVALLLAAAKNVIPFDQALRRADWTMRYQKPAPSLLLKGKTVLILGYGKIGRQVARICSSLGMNVIAIKRRAVTGETDQFVKEIHTPRKLHELLPHAQVLVVALPLTQETDGLLGESELDLLPTDSVLVNIGRGLIVNEEALYRSLKNGNLGAAGLDVWYNYPASEESRTSTYPANFPFWELDNVVLSPHRAGSTNEIDYLRMDHLAILLNAVARNEQVPNRVNLNHGY